MRCKSCTKQLLGRGSRLETGLCSDCASVSDYYLWRAVVKNDEKTGSMYAEPCSDRFNDFVIRHDLEKSWAQGLGLMPSEARKAHLRAKAWEEYATYLGWGLGHEGALRRATGLSNRRNAKPVDDGILPNEPESWVVLWEDDLYV